MNTPEVSVVMINHNGMPWLQQAVQSVLACEGPAIELIVVDDCSQDGSRTWLHGMEKSDKRLRLVLLAENVGISSARNHGMEAATGEFISLIDSDDLFLADTIDRQLETFRSLEKGNSRVSLLMSDAWLINESNQRVGRYISKDYWDRVVTSDPPLWTLPSTFFFRREGSAQFHPGYRSADAPIFVRRMEQQGQLAFSGFPLIEYRLRMSSVTNVSGARMLREMNAAEQSRNLGRLNNPLESSDVPEPDLCKVKAWIHGRNAKNAAANGRHAIAVKEVSLAALAEPRLTCQKLRRALQTFGKRVSGS